MDVGLLLAQRAPKHRIPRQRRLGTRHLVAAAFVEAGRLAEHRREKGKVLNPRPAAVNIFHTVQSSRSAGLRDVLRERDLTPSVPYCCQGTPARPSPQLCPLRNRLDVLECRNQHLRSEVARLIRRRPNGAQVSGRCGQGKRALRVQWKFVEHRDFAGVGREALSQVDDLVRLVVHTRPSSEPHRREGTEMPGEREGAGPDGRHHRATAGDPR